MDKRLLLPFAALLILQAACIIGRPTVTPTAPLLPVPAEGTQPIITQAPSPLPTQPSGTRPTATESATPSLPPPPPTAGVYLTLQVIAPEDGAVVNTPQVDVIGMTAPGAVVTVNDDILLVGADGRFQSTVSLEEGPNLIEIVVSDIEGNEASMEFTVIYEP